MRYCTGIEVRRRSRLSSGAVTIGASETRRDVKGSQQRCCEKRRLAKSTGADLRHRMRTGLSVS